MSVYVFVLSAAMKGEMKLIY